jgi:hypothetical protein
MAACPHAANPDATCAQDGFGTGLDRSHVCYNTEETLVVMITDTCEAEAEAERDVCLNGLGDAAGQPPAMLVCRLSTGSVGVLTLSCTTCTRHPATHCRPMPLPRKRLQQQTLVLW